MSKQYAREMPTFTDVVVFCGEPEFEDNVHFSIRLLSRGAS